MQYVDCFFVSTAGVVNQFSAIGSIQQLLLCLFWIRKVSPSTVNTYQ